MNNNSLIKKINYKFRRLFITIGCILAITFSWQFVGLATASNAMAAQAPSDDYHQTPPDSYKKIRDNADRFGGYGTSDQIEGKAKRDIGTVQKQIGKVTGQVEGASKQAQGKVQEDIGTTKNVIEQANNQIQEKSEDVVDAVKDFFKKN